MNSNFRGWPEKLLGRFGARSRKQQIVILVACFMIAAGAVGLITYGISVLASARTIRELREAGEETGPAPTESVTSPAGGTVPAAPEWTEEPGSSERPAETSVPVIETAPADGKTGAPGEPVSRRGMLPETGYPDNPGKQISSYFHNLQQMNKDIVGWLKMGGIVDEAVVQRDNEFYLDHDAMGRNNVNGALFLDEGVNLDIRPYSYIIYGHNMRVGAEFGSLRNYEKAAFYRADPFISLNTVYEEGRYVIFAIATVNVIDEQEEHFVDFLALMKNNAEEREEAIRVLQECSIYPDWLDVRPEDQLLLLVTCVSADDERRIVAARRIRDNERETDLIQMINDVVR